MQHSSALSFPQAFRDTPLLSPLFRTGLQFPKGLGPELMFWSPSLSHVSWLVISPTTLLLVLLSPRTRVTCQGSQV